MGNKETKSMSTRVDVSTYRVLEQYADECDMSLYQLAGHLIEGFAANVIEEGKTELGVIDDEYATELRNERREKSSYHAKRAAYFLENVEEELQSLLSAQAEPALVENILENRIEEAHDYVDADHISEEHYKELKAQVWRRYKQYTEAYGEMAEEQDNPFGDRSDVKGSEAYRSAVDNFSDTLAQEPAARANIREKVQKYTVADAPDGMGADDVMDAIYAEAYEKVLESINEHREKDIGYDSLIRDAKQLNPNKAADDILAEADMLAEEDEDDSGFVTPDGGDGSSLQPSCSDGGVDDG